MVSVSIVFDQPMYFFFWDFQSLTLRVLSLSKKKQERDSDFELKKNFLLFQDFIY